MGHFLEAGLTPQGGEEVRSHGSASGASLGFKAAIRARLGLEFLEARSLAWLCAAWVASLPSQVSAPSSLTGPPLPASRGCGADSTDVAPVGVSPKPGRSKGTKVLPVGGLLRVPHRHPARGRTGPRTSNVYGAGRGLAGNPQLPLQPECWPRAMPPSRSLSFPVANGSYHAAGQAGS